MEIDITSISIAIMVVVGGVFGTKMYLSHANASPKALKTRIKLMEENEDFMKKQIQKYKNKASNMERGPQIEGDLDELGGILPDLVGQFSDYLPRWAQPLVKDPDTQKWLMEYVTKNPDKAKEFFGKIVGKKATKSEGAETEPTMSV